MPEDCRKGKDLANRTFAQQSSTSNNQTSMTSQGRSFLAHLAELAIQDELCFRQAWLLAMAEAPNILILLLLTSTIEGLNGLCYFFDLCLATIFLAWAYNETHQFSTRASKFDKSLRVQLQQQSFKPTRNIYRYHCFKVQMKLKKKRKFIKPSPLFYLARK